MHLGASRVAVFLLALYILADYSLARGVPFWAASYALLVGSSLLLLATDLRLTARVVADSLAIRIGLLLWAVWFLAVIAQPVVYLKYVIGDAATVLLPLIYLALGLACRDLFLLPENRWFILAAVVLGSLAAPFIAVGMVGRNFDPPHYFLFASLWIALFRSPGRIRGLVIASAIIVALLLSLGSGQRSGVVVAFLCAMVVIWMRLRARGINVLFVSTTAIAVVAALAALPLGYALSGQGVSGVAAKALLEDSRMHKTGADDASILVRLREGQDVLHQHRARSSNVQRLIGNGHGSYYVPNASYVPRNLTEEGYVHNIHFGPLLVLHRYGYAGLGVLLAIVFLIVRDLTGRKRWWADGRSIRPESVFLVAVIIGLINFSLRNSLTDPVFSYCLAGWLYCRSFFPSQETRLLGTTNA
jgi:hypothetical protein